MKRKWGLVVSSLFVLLFVVGMFRAFVHSTPAVGEGHKNPPRWIGSGPWSYNIVSQSGGPIQLTYLLYAFREPAQHSLNLRFTGQGMALHSLNVRANRLATSPSLVYELRMSGNVTGQATGSPWRLSTTLAGRRNHFTLGDAWIGLLPREPRTLQQLTGDSGTFGVFSPTHVYSVALKNIGNRDVTIAGVRQAGHFSITHISCLPGRRLLPLHIPAQAARMPATGIVVRPGAIITLYADISNYGRGVRNVAFQPALLTRSGGSLTSEVLPLFTWVNGVPPRL